MTCPESECPAPTRERRRAPVIFEADQDHKSSYVVRGHSADLLNSNDDDEADEKGTK